MRKFTIIVRIFVSLHKMSLEYSEGSNNTKHAKQALGDIIFLCDHVTLKLGLPGLSLKQAQHDVKVALTTVLDLILSYHVNWSDKGG